MINDNLLPVSDSESVISDLEQLDGNVSLRADNGQRSGNLDSTQPINNYRQVNASVAHHLPTVTVCNMRSLFPKLDNFKIEHQLDFSMKLKNASNAWFKILFNNPHQVVGLPLLHSEI